MKEGSIVAYNITHPKEVKKYKGRVGIFLEKCRWPRNWIKVLWFDTGTIVKFHPSSLYSLRGESNEK